jgi:hypothetical protein
VSGAAKKDGGNENIVDKHLMDISVLDEMASRILDTSCMMMNTEYHRGMNVGPGDGSLVREGGEREKRELLDLVDLSRIRASDVQVPGFDIRMEESHVRKSTVKRSPVRFSDPVESPMPPDKFEPELIEAHVEFEKSPLQHDMIEGFESLESVSFGALEEEKNPVWLNSHYEFEQNPARIKAHVGFESNIPEASGFLTPTRVSPSPREEKSIPEEFSEYLSEEDSVLQKMLAPQTPLHQGEMQLDEIMIEDRNHEGVDLTHLFTKVGSVHQNRLFDHQVGEGRGDDGGCEESEGEMNSPISISLSKIEERSGDAEVENDILDSSENILDESYEGAMETEIGHSSSQVLLDSNGKSRGLFSKYNI